MADFNGSDNALAAFTHYSGVVNARGFEPINLTPGDVVSPVVVPTTPTASPQAPTAPLAFYVSDDQRLKGVVVIASYTGSNTRELVWDDTHGFNGFYLGTANTVAVTYAAPGIPKRYDFTILRDGGWPADITITVFAYDGSGNPAGGF